jgi:hypothetical protein
LGLTREKKQRPGCEMETDRRLSVTESLGGRAVHRLHAFTMATGILLVLCYRATFVPAAGEGHLPLQSFLVLKSGNFVQVALIKFIFF